MSRANRGITLVEMLIVVALIGLMVGISFPSITSGVDSLRLLTSTDAVSSFLNGALNRAERRQQVIEISFSKEERKLTMRSSEPGFSRELVLPDGVTIIRTDPDVKSVFVYPGGAVPRIALDLENRRKARRRIQVDPITGVPQVEIIE